jgi:hypothetical protein
LLCGVVGIVIQIHFLCGRINLNVLIAWVQFSQLSFVFQDHATTVTICVVSWLLLW